MAPFRDWLSRMFHSDRMDSCALKGRGMERTETLRKKLAFSNGPDSIKDLKSNAAQASFFALSDVDLIKEIKRAFDDEMKILQQASPTAEAAGAITIGGYGPKNLSPSKLMYGKDYNEVNRTVVGALALKWIVNNDYEKFTKHQPEKMKLKPESFETIRTHVLADIGSPDELYFVLVSMIINDLGKKDKPPEKSIARSDSSGLSEKKFGVATPNHDELIYEDACSGKIALLNEFGGKDDAELHRWLLLGLKLGAKLNIPQFAQAENVPASLSAITELKGQPRALDFKILEVVLDVAGAQGHVDSRCALAMLEPTWQSFATSRSLLAEIAAHRITESEAYNSMLEARADLLVNTGFPRLSTKVQSERALLRLVTMGRALENKGYAELIEAAFKSLSETARGKLVQGLSVTGVKDGTAIIPYYAPSLFANIFRCVDKAHLDDDRKTAALAALLRFLVRVYRDTKPIKADAGMVVECKLSFVGDTITSEAFLENPNVLDEMEVSESHYTHAFDQWIR